MERKTNGKIRMLALLAGLVMLLGSLPVAAGADALYIIPDSNTRKLTREEVWQYQYDTLLYAFNEIYARHGYKFETGSRCYNWFTQMPWYTPNESESSTITRPTASAAKSRTITGIWSSTSGRKCGPRRR